MSDAKLIIAVAVIAAVTALLRFLPFLVFGGKRTTPKAVEYLGKVLPYSIMGMLVVYCLRNINFADLSGFLPALISAAVVAAAHIWKRNTIISIVGGTVCYMLLVQLVF